MLDILRTCSTFNTHAFYAHAQYFTHMLDILRTCSTLIIFCTHMIDFFTHMHEGRCRCHLVLRPASPFRSFFFDVLKKMKENNISGVDLLKPFRPKFTDKTLIGAN
jgi:hypothetical protein